MHFSPCRIFIIFRFILIDKTRTKCVLKQVIKHVIKIRYTKKIDTIMENSYLSIEYVKNKSKWGVFVSERKTERQELTVSIFYPICHINSTCKTQIQHFLIRVLKRQPACVTCIRFIAQSAILYMSNSGLISSNKDMRGSDVWEIKKWKPI